MLNNAWVVGHKRAREPLNLHWPCSQDKSCKEQALANKLHHGCRIRCRQAAMCKDDLRTSLMSSTKCYRRTVVCHPSLYQSSLPQSVSYTLDIVHQPGWKPDPNMTCNSNGRKWLEWALEAHGGKLDMWIHGALLHLQQSCKRSVRLRIWPTP